MEKKRNKYERDEKKSIIIALVVSAVVVIAIVLAYFAVKKYQFSDNNANNNAENTENADEIGSSQGNIVVTNQEELNAALEDPATISILFQTEEEQHIVIPERDYRPIEFIIDAPYTSVTNCGTFAKVTIYRVDSNTWTENATENNFLVDSAACHIVVGASALVNTIENVQDSSTLAIESQGTIELLAQEADSAIVSVQSDGMVRQLQIYKNTNIKLTGSQEIPTGVEIEYGADGTILNCSIPAAVSSFVSATLYFEGGANNSEVAVKSSNATIQVTNSLTDSLKVITADGTESVVEASETSVFSDESSSGEEDSLSNTAVSSSGAGTPSTGTSAASNSTGNSTSSSSASSAGSTGGNRTYVTSGYTKEQVDQMVASAVEAATKQMVDKETANAMVEKAVKEATKKTKKEATAGMITQEKAQELVQEAVKDMITQEKAQEMVKDATKDMVPLSTAQQMVADATKDMVSQSTAQQMVTDATKDMVSQSTAQEMVKDAVDSAVQEVLSKPIVVSFSEAAPIFVEGKTSGENAINDLPAAEELVLPSYVYGHTYLGEIYRIPVISWQNLDGYSQNAAEGSYRFAAILQTIPECTVAGGVRAITTVYVKLSDNQEAITYKNKEYQKTITIRGNDIADQAEALIGEKVSYYYITNNSDTDVTYVALNFYYYDKNGRPIAENNGRWYGRNLQPGESCIAYRENPCMEYAGYFVEVDAEASDNSPAERYCKTEVSYLNENGESVETPTRYMQIKLYKRNIYLNISECNITFLHYGENNIGQRVVLGAETISTGRDEIRSINSTEENTPIVLKITLPESTMETVYTVVGGYAIDEQTETADRTENTTNSENKVNSESTGIIEEEQK